MIAMLRKLPRGQFKKYGRRPPPLHGCIELPMNMIRSEVTVPFSLKGPSHCSQRVFAALLHLQFNVEEARLDSLFELEPIINLGEDADPMELNACFRSPAVIEWLSRVDRRLVPQLMGPVVGDIAAREVLRNLKANEAVYTYPVDYRGVGRHCSLAFRPKDGGKVVIWDPSPTFDGEKECPLWTRHNETMLNFRGYEAVRRVRWVQLRGVQQKNNSRRAAKRKWCKAFQASLVPS